MSNIIANFIICIDKGLQNIKKPLYKPIVTDIVDDRIFVNALEYYKKEKQLHNNILLYSTILQN